MSNNFKVKNNTVKPKLVREGVTTTASTTNTNTTTTTNPNTTTNDSSGTCGCGPNLLWIILAIFFVVILIFLVSFVFFKTKTQPGGFQVGGPSFQYTPAQGPPQYAPPPQYSAPNPYLVQQYSGASGGYGGNPVTTTTAFESPITNPYSGIPSAATTNINL